MQSPRRTQRRGGFTVLELLAVVAIIGVIGGLFLPVLAGARARSKAVECLAHLREFSLAVTTYAGDQGDSLPPNRPGATVKPGQTWVRGWLWGASSDATNTTYLRTSSLGPYLQGAPLWRCPGDLSTVRIAGKIYPRVRSISMNQYLGAPVPFRDRLTYSRLSDVAASPIDLWLFTDESVDTLDDGTFAVTEDFSPAEPNAWRIADLPGVYHQRGTGMAFADGHAGIKLWTDPRTIMAFSGYQTMPRNEDLLWLESHSSSPR